MGVEGVAKAAEAGGGRETVGRITNLILQMDPKTWKQWNI